MKIDLHYGKDLLSLQVPENNIEQVIRPWSQEQAADNALITDTLQCPEAEQFQRQIAGKRLCVLTEDGTRDGPFELLFEQFFGLVKPSSHVLFVICTGTHDAETPENNLIKACIKKAAEKAGVRNFTIHTHDCQQDTFLNAGTTSRGTDVLYAAAVDDVDVFVVLSDMKTHYFAGYSNPIKNFVPGICAFETAEHNHSLALETSSTFGTHPWHSDESKRANPVADDMLEAMKLIVKDRPVYTLATISASGTIQWARFGLIEPVTREGFDRIDEQNTHTVRPMPRLIVSPGGFPNDTSLYIAQRALELTRYAVTDGGEVLFLAACANGVGEQRTIDNFYNRLTAPLDEVLESIEGEYKMYTHKPYKFAQLIKRLNRIWMYSHIPDQLIEAAHLYPTHQPQAVIDNWLRQDPGTRITIVDGANKIALYAGA